MGDSVRIDKLNSEFQKEIAEVIARKLKNPLISAMVSITGVETSKDISHAKVYVSVYSTDLQKKQTTFDEIVKESKRIRYEVAKVMRIRYVPEFHFILDDSFEYGSKMDKLLNSLDKGKEN